MVLGSSGGARGVLRVPLPGPAAGAIVRNAVTFEDVVREYQDDVYGAALRILGDRDAARDAANQTFMKAYRSIGSYDPSRPIKHWLLRIAVNEAITIGRARTRERGRIAPEADAAAVPDRSATPEAETLDRESRDGIRAAVAALPDLYREVVVLRYFNELSVDEVAAVLGRSSSTVGVQLLRARQLLRKAMEGQGV
ncbi:MAG TPA: sigma-70 family RNA polymerase sigma factor [Candidatus Limnocylindria bacterium]|nr:sigma-70 family RNA polymerase sigma factor [Candidatus Limnocylindria bacterium]